MSESLAASSAPPRSGPSAVAWGAVAAGAFAAAAFSLALLILGAGIGLASVSPWSVGGGSGTTFGALTAAWFVAVQLFAFGLGGYLAGRLRNPWPSLHVDEAHFRDTAHGLLVWAVGGVITALLVAGAATSLASSAGHATAVAAANVGGAAMQQGSGGGDASAYFTDMLLRSDHPSTIEGPAARAELRRILAKSLASGDFSAADKAYAASMVAAGTGLSQADAEKRIGDVLDQAKAAAAEAATTVKKAADAARATGVYISLWGFIALLIGAFSASYMAVVGGRHREEGVDEA